MSIPYVVSLDRTLPRREPQPSLSPPARSVGWRRILVAIDGTAATDAALRTVHALALEGGCAVDVAVIYSPRIPPPATPTRRGLDACERTERIEALALIKAVRNRCRVLVPRRSEREAWHFHLEVGDSGATLVRLAAELRADLVIVGLMRRGPFDTSAGERTAICAARYLPVAMLAVAAGDAPVSRALVVLPDGRLHAPTLRAVVATVARPARIWIAVPEGISAPKAFADSEALHAEVHGVCGSAVSATIRGVRLEQIVVDGDMLSGAIRLAGELDARLIAVPNHGDPGPVRIFLPNLAEPLLFGAQCSVLVVPDGDVTSK